MTTFSNTQVLNNIIQWDYIFVIQTEIKVSLITLLFFFFILHKYYLIILES